MTQLIAQIQQSADYPPQFAMAIEIALRASLILAIAGLATCALRRSSAASRHLIWSLGLTATLLIIPLTILLPRLNMRVLPETQLPQPPPAAFTAKFDIESNPRTEPSRVAAPLPTVIGPRHDIMLARGVEPVSEPESHRSLWFAGFFAVWLGGSVVVLCPLVYGMARTRRIVRRCVPLTDTAWNELVGEVAGRIELLRPVTLLKGQPAEMPMTWGLFRHVILLPAEAESWSRERRTVVLLHELSHVRRRDCLTQALARLACSVHWYNPLAWLAARELRSESEQACDDLVLSSGERPSIYAGHLLEIARSHRTSANLSAAAVAMARPSRFEGRLRGILDTTRNRRVPSRWLAAASLVAILAISATIAAVRLEARAVESRVVSGTIQAPDGKLVEGVSVHVIRTRPAWGRYWNPQPVDILGKAITDAEGRFRVDLDNFDQNAEADYAIVTQAPKFGQTTSKLKSPLGAIPEPIRLEAEQPFRIRITDREGVPVAGADVRLESAYAKSGDAGFSEWVITALRASDASKLQWKTDADGKFAPTGISPGFEIAFRVTAPGFGQQRLQFDSDSEPNAATLKIGKAYILEGRVTLGNGGPPAVGSRIETLSMSENYGMGMTLGRAVATTDADGRYRLEVAPGASIRVEAFPPSIEAGPYLVRGKLIVPGVMTAHRADFALPKGVLVRGRIVEAGTEKPVAGAIVFHQAQKKNNPDYVEEDAAAWFNMDKQHVFTDKDGRYAIAVMPGPGYLLANAPTGDFVPEEIPFVELYGDLIWPNQRIYPDAFRKIVPKAGEGPIDVDLSFRRGTPLRGEVLAADGKPVKDAILLSRWYVPPDQMTLETDAGLPISNGRFELKSCDPAGSAQVLLLDARNQQGVVVDQKGDMLAGGLKATLQPCGSATVRFVNAEGKPIVGRAPGHVELVLTPGESSSAGLFLMYGRKKQSPIVADSIFMANLDPQRYRDLKTDANGRMTFPTLIPGATYRVEVFNQTVKTQIEFTVKPGEVRDLGELVIRQVGSAF